MCLRRGVWMCLKARAIKMNVLSQGDKHVNKTCGARGGEDMGRAHLHSRLHPLRRSAPRRAARVAAHTLLPAAHPALPGPCRPVHLEFPGCRWAY